MCYRSFNQACHLASTTELVVGAIMSYSMKYNNLTYNYLLCVLCFRVLKVLIIFDSWVMEITLPQAQKYFVW